MQKGSIILLVAGTILISSCRYNSANNPPAKDTTVTNSIDSSANNGILPPSAAPGNANNSSLADTAYKAKDSVKKK